MLNPCKRLKVVCVGIDKDGNMMMRENGNLFECTGEEGNCGCIHAEVNLIKEMPHPKEVIITHSPCLTCAIMLYNAGVKKVTYLEPYRKKEGIEYLKKKGVKVEYKKVFVPTY